MRELFGGLLSVNFWKIFRAKVNKAGERERGKRWWMTKEEEKRI
jgi:hypothetical protein